IHTCYRITDIDRSVAFYDALGFEEAGRFQLPDGATNVFMGLPDDGARLELTYNPGVESYDIGTGYGHIAVTAGDLDGALQRLAGARASAQAIAPAEQGWPRPPERPAPPPPRPRPPRRPPAPPRRRSRPPPAAPLPGPGAHPPPLRGSHPTPKSKPLPSHLTW